MIISLRGTNGSGKSTIVRSVMSSCRASIEIEYPGRRQPTGYVLDSKIFVPGHYRIANGGIDTLPSLDFAYDLVRIHALEMGLSVLYEGKNLSDGCLRLLALRDAGADVAVALIDVPIKTCVAAVRERGHSIRADRIEALAKKCWRDAERFRREGVETHVGNRASVERQVRAWLDL